MEQLVGVLGLSISSYDHMEEVVLYELSLLWCL